MGQKVEGLGSKTTGCALSAFLAELSALLSLLRSAGQQCLCESPVRILQWLNCGLFFLLRDFVGSVRDVVC